MSFTDQSAVYLRDEYLPRMKRVVESLDPADTWWRPHDGVLAIGNILLHLEGNVRQWILTSIGGRPDVRDRASEFAARDGDDAAVLFEPLRDTVLEACEVVNNLAEPALMAQYKIQDYEISGYGAIYHVVEHFSWHTGQAVWIAKARGGADHGIAFYDDASLNNPDRKSVV